MREIKFRAWDRRKKFIYEVIQVDWERQMVKVNTWEWLRNENKWGWRLVNWERFVLQQSTGLKDKNWVEIYEGDIVQNDFFEKPLWFIDFFQKDWAFKINHNNEWSSYLCNFSELEIIWNIYENPEE